MYRLRAIVLLAGVTSLSLVAFGQNTIAARNTAQAMPRFFGRASGNPITRLRRPLMLSAATPSYQAFNPTTTLAAETSNNTSAANTFAGFPNGNLKASNVSKVDIHTLLNPGSAAKVVTTYIPYWGNPKHPNVGYSSQDPAQVAREVADLTSRGFDGVLVDWYGKGSWEDGATYVLKQALEQQTHLTFALMIDVGAVQWYSCYPTCNATTALLNTINYARARGYFSSPAAMHTPDGKILVTQFGLEVFSIDWTAVRAANTDLEWIFENAGAFNTAGVIGAYGWLSPQTLSTEPANYEGLDYLQYFLKIANVYLAKQNWVSTWKGFNDTIASWAPPGGRHIEQLCGKTWLDTWAAIRSFSGRVDAVQVVTWHDYEEGTEIQTGIDNCLTLSATVSGSQLNWKVSSESTLDHYTVFVSTDGRNLMSLGDFAVGTRQLDLSAFNLAPGSYQVFVKAVGKPSIVNHMSAAAAYKIASATLATPTVKIVTPYNNQIAGPYTNLQVQASSANGAIQQYQISVDNKLVKTLGGAPSLQSWVPTGMGSHVIQVSVKDKAGVVTNVSTSINRTY